VEVLLSEHDEDLADSAVISPARPRRATASNSGCAAGDASGVDGLAVVNA
jgi:hypothetical protein